ncbi:hypothetical protein SDC9_177997 [bioreactor metagenome]|uniref:Uncharacterized protein n=1 Tax=bioreactor metagenome TaxID=1076179 RepID=A0A645GW87_9ZZZZ
MDKGKEVVEGAVEVQQAIRMDAIDPGSVCAGGFSFIGININPALAESPGHGALVLFAQRGYGLQHNFSCFIKGKAAAVTFDYGDEEVIKMEILIAKGLAAKSQVFLQRF